MPFSKHDEARIAAGVKRLDRLSRTTPQGRGKYPVVGGGSVLIPAFTNSSVASGSYTAPPSVNVTLAVPNNSGAGPGFVPGTVVVGAFNLYVGGGVGIGANKLVWVTIQNTAYYIVNADC